jgi:hypothetical protein
MKKIVASVGLVALGASGVQAASPSPFDSDAPKPWSLSAKLRGFYDDNFQTLPDGQTPAGTHRETFGFEVTPSLTIRWPLEQTTISLGYIYGLKYYEHKPIGNTENYDQTHTFNASLDHAFNERYSVSLTDSFVIGQEPDVLRAGNSFATFQRISGDNIRNYASITFNAQLTRQFGLDIGYANSLYDYTDSAYSLNHATTGPVTVTTVSASNSGLLDRLEHTFHLDGRWQIRPQTIGILGYQYGLVGYDADQLIGGSVTNTPAGQTGRFYKSNVRDNSSHYGYLGVDHTFRADWSGSLRAGARYNDYYNDPYSQNEPSPYVNASTKYTYMAGSYAELGATYDRSATDLFSDVPGQSLTTDAQTLSAWLNVHQRITPKLTGTLTFQFQNSTYNGGTYNSQTDRFYLLGLNFEYRFNPHLSAELGYSYDLLDSEIPNRGFDRNRVYAGITASY